MAMNHKHKRRKRKRQVIRVWTYPQARRALPYITPIMRSLREHWLDAQRHDVQGRKLARRAGRPDRATLLAQEDTAQEAREAKDRFNEAYEELQQIEVYCIDPNQGVAVLPFVQDDKLAWLIYDLFASEEFHHWRFHDDPLEQRRPIAEALASPAGEDVVI
jgi:hypothetical protein